MVPITIIIQEKDGIDREGEPVTVGVPLPAGGCFRLERLALEDDAGVAMPLQKQILARWPDGSAQWLLLDFQAHVATGRRRDYTLRLGGRLPGEDGANAIRVADDGNTFTVDTGALVAHIDKRLYRPFDRVLRNGKAIVAPHRCRTWLIDERGVAYEPAIDRFVAESEGPLRATLLCEGRFLGPGKSPFANFFSRLTFFTGSACVKVDFCLHNPRAAEHPGGLWDLGDPGSIHFKELAMRVQLAGEGPAQVRWTPALDVAVRTEALDRGETFGLYQESSGGDNWAHRNHRNRFGEVPMRFGGYRVDKNGRPIGEGRRAEPFVSVTRCGRAVSAVMPGFWQNFPKALGAEADSLSISFFPRQFPDTCELQAGERKTHAVYLRFDDEPAAENWRFRPLIPAVDPAAISRAGVFPYIPFQERAPDPRLEAIIQAAVDGDRSFFSRREVIDEYGWRNFGDLYADHEGMLTDPPEPLVSHYNNQYDCLFGLLTQFMRSADPGWFQLADALCAHICDIDIYHTDRDRPEFNGGMFWHTEHYIDAETATHRCFSKKHAGRRNLAAYGGGPSLSHVYARGLLLHHWLTGSPVSRDAVLGLAGYVMANLRMDSTLGNRGLGAIRRFRQRLASRVKGESLVQMAKVYGLDGPGRASGNALNVLVDAFRLTAAQQYLAAAEGLIRQCIGPGDDIGGRDLLDAENRWMYTVFLQALGHYLDAKGERGQRDSAFAYARESLLAYAFWMVENERPFLSHPEKLEYPNETWAAQELRKACVLRTAARCASAADSDKLLKAAESFFERAADDLQSFETRFLTRPTAIVLQNYVQLAEPRQETARPGPDESPARRGSPPEARIAAGNGSFPGFSLAAEKQFIYWRLPQKLRHPLSRFL